MAGAMLTVGNVVAFGAGNLGVGPVPSETCSLARSPQALSTAADSSDNDRIDSQRRCGRYMWNPHRG
ncbi:hypothetical protein ACFQ0H_26955 [Lysobacter gummosus]|uniref:hypothetical protein n=1 Tax=Lysobacter gummosus TaxID=262324 RepID=UPI00362CBD4F